MSANAGDVEIAIQAAGSEQAQQDLASVEEQMNETTSAMGDSADEMSGLQRKMSGLGGALVASLAVAAGGLLSQVPVLGQAFEGLTAVVEAVAFQVDQVLRPALGPLSEALFELSSAVMEADGDLGGLIGRIGAVGGAVSLLLGALFALGVTITGPLLLAIGAIAAAVAALWTAWSTDFGNIRTITMQTIGAIMDRFNRFVAVVRPLVMGFLDTLSGVWQRHGDTIMRVIRFVFRTISAVIRQVVDTVLSVIQFALQLLAGDWEGAWQTMLNFFERTVSRWAPLVNDAIDAVVSFISGVDWMQLGKDVINALIEGIKAAGSALKSAIKIVVKHVTDALGTLGEDAKQWGSDLVNEFIAGIRSRIDAAKSAVNDLAQAVRDRMPGSPAQTGPLSDLDQTGPGLVDTFAAGIEGNIGAIGGGGGGGGGGDDSGGVLANRGRDITLNLDGREAARVTQQYGADETNRRGRFGSE